MWTLIDVLVHKPKITPLAMEQAMLGVCLKDKIMKEII